MRGKYRNYNILGSHLINENSQKGVRFSVWASNALSVSVVGYFNYWNGNSHRMEQDQSNGVWSVFIPGLKVNTVYKYEITSAEGKKFQKIDPYAFGFGISPDFSCRVIDLSQFEWEDDEWMKKRASADKWQRPLSIYEVHAGSWRRKDNGRYYSYIDLAHSLTDYTLSMGFTHIELMPIMEHPFDGSWGYQCTGYFAPNSRFGHPIDLMYFIDYCHRAGIGVILDLVPGHFCRDRHALAWFDGEACYEYKDTRHQKNDWGCNNFDLSKPEVREFLISSALFWLDKYHFDAIRVDAVADTMHRGQSYDEAGVSFMQTLNHAVREEYPDVLMIAEDSSGRKRVTEEGGDGLSFNYRWHMGWTHDAISFMREAPEHRKHHINKLLWTMECSREENYILPLSHDEMAHGRGSLISKMPGSGVQKLKNLKLLIGWQFIHPGKKLIFMSLDLAQKDGWRFNSEIDWTNLDKSEILKFQLLIKHLNEFYKNSPALWQLDKGEIGAKVEFCDYDNAVIVIKRSSWNDNDSIIAVANFSETDFDSYHIGVDSRTPFKVILSTDFEEYGGKTTDKALLYPENFSCMNKPYRINIKLPPLTILIIGKVQI